MTETCAPDAWAEPVPSNRLRHMRPKQATRNLFAVWGLVAFYRRFLASNRFVFGFIQLPALYDGKPKATAVRLHLQYSSRTDADVRRELAESAV